jgi:glycosyltransferase involved in cell wall biosynthesis
VSGEQSDISQGHEVAVNILFLARWYPYPADNGSKIRTFNLIRQLAAHHSVHLVSFASETPSPERIAAMRALCPTVETAVFRDFAPGRASAVAGFASPKPRYFVDTYSVEMQRLAQRAFDRVRPDLVFASEVDMAPYAIKLPERPRLLDDIELTMPFERYAGAAHLKARLRHGMAWWKVARYVAQLMRQFDGCTVVSSAERARAMQVAPDYQAVTVVPNGIDGTKYEGGFGSPEPDTLVYAGSLTYSANFDAVKFFLADIFPLVRQARPGTKLVVTGKLDGVPLDQLPLYESVTYTGYLDDVRPAVAQSWASIVPLRQGGGTRLKILESLALGTPVISTGKGAEGLELEPERDILIADAPQDFARAVVRVLDDAALRERMRQNGRREVLAKYDWRSIGEALCRFVDQLVLENARVRVAR